VKVNEPTLINSVYNSYQFWDGRAAALEEVVQRSLEDERPAAGQAERHHVWSGVVERLRAEPRYKERFLKVFGTAPTQDAVGKALATYLRTILSGNSVEDRAEQERMARKGKGLTAADYEKALDGTALELFQRPTSEKAELAKELHDGHLVFRG